MKKEIILSICIPTYNREKELRGLLESISTNSAYINNCDKIEIVISDNNSKDNTQDLILGYKTEFKHLKYSRNQNNLGFGINLNLCIANANGKYCWLIGSDELITTTGLEDIIDVLNNNSPDLMICSALTRGVVRQMYDLENRSSFSITTSGDLVSLINRANEVSGLFAFMSVIVVRRDYWNSHDVESKIVSHDYTHAIKIFFLIKETQLTNFKYLKTPVVITGSSINEFNMQPGKHLILDLFTYKYICENIIDRFDVRDVVSKVFAKQYTKNKIEHIKKLSSNENWERIKEGLKYFNINGYSDKKTWIDPIYSFGFNLTIKLVRRIKRITKNFVSKNK